MHSDKHLITNTHERIMIINEGDFNYELMIFIFFKYQHAINPHLVIHRSQWTTEISPVAFDNE